MVWHLHFLKKVDWINCNLFCISSIFSTYLCLFRFYDHLHTYYFPITCYLSLNFREFLLLFERAKWNVREEGRKRKEEGESGGDVGRGEPAGGARWGRDLSIKGHFCFLSIAFGWPHSHYPSSNTLWCLRAELSPLGLVLWILVPSWLSYKGRLWDL